MSDYKYHGIVKHYEECLARHGDTHLGVDWPNALEAKKRYSVMLGVIREKDRGDPISLLDFGCGASHLYEHLRLVAQNNLCYTGLDASAVFCDLSKNKYPMNDYHCIDVLKDPERLGEYDYVVMNGVFTEKHDLNFDEMFEYFKQVLRAVFPKTRHGLAFNVMSKAVDWERDDLFHLPTDLLISFLVGELTRHFVIRNDYGLYEYTVYLYKEPANG